MNEFNSDFTICYLCNKTSAYLTPEITKSKPFFNDFRIKCPKVKSNITLCLLCSEEVQFEKSISKQNESNDVSHFSAEKACHNLEEQIKYLENIAFDPHGFLEEYFFELVNKIDLRREELKKEIDVQYEQILQDINSFRSSCENQAEQNYSIETIILKEKLKKWKLILEMNDLDDKNWSSIKSQADENTIVVRKDLNELIKLILQRKKINFDVSIKPCDLISSIFKVDFTNLK
ncbi:unnamed protein product [Brachionus calyciflorus]|uniref:Uncharacterized protein n=1 Tax=Brachionus calyciflorus TaxID=104777 RepID=A0A813P472_9BILA|nr:unnamed protein product [Brachionus calyciflorus]